MRYQIITVTESTGKSHKFLMPEMEESSFIKNVSFSEPLEEAPHSLALSRKNLKILSYLFSLMALHLNGGKINN